MKKTIGMIIIFFIIFTGCAKQELVDEAIIAQHTLINFFNNLNEWKFTEALKYFTINKKTRESLDIYNPDRKIEHINIIENYCQATLTCLPVIIVWTTKIDDNKTYTSGFMGEGEEYTEVIDNVEYTYTKVLGTWIKDSEELTEEDDETIAEDEYAELFNADNYEYDKEIDKYVLKEGVKTTFMEGMQATTLTLELTDNGCVFIGKVNSDGVLMPITITMKDLNNTEIVLPTV